MQPANRALVEPLLAQPAEQGALPSLRAATAPDVQGGQYYGPSGFQQLRGAPKLVRSTGASYDTAAQERLWTVSQELTGVAYPV